MLTKFQRGKVADVRAIPGLWLDIDLDRGPTGGASGLRPHASQNLPRDEEQACAILEALPPPTAIVDSGFGWHCYWLLEVAHPIGYGDEDLVGAASKAFHGLALARAADLGLHIDDGIWNLDRILRLPGTVNTKGGGAEPVHVLIDDGPRYGSLNALMDAAGLDMRLMTAPGAIRPGGLPEDIPDELCEPRADGAERQTPEWIKESLARLHNEESRALLGKVLAGESFAPPGNRDTTLQKVASVIAYLAPDRDPHELADELLADSLATFDDVDAGTWTQADRLQWAADKIARAQVDARRDRVHRERQDKAIADVLVRQARSTSRRDQRLGPAPQGPYSDAEVGTFAAQQMTDSSGFAKRWIIQKNTSYYVYINGDYQLPLTAQELDVSLPRDLAPAAAGGHLRLDTYTAKGEPRRKTTKELLADYASVARQVVTRLDLGFSYYEEDSQTFFEASCPIRPLESTYCPEVDRWLHLLGGAQVDKLLDWIATVTMLSKQSSALYLEGPKGIGKGCLSHGLARLWHRGAPTELSSILGEWSADLARCPLVLADEQIKESFKGQRNSAELRTLIASSGRTLKRKYRDNSDLIGAIRLILAANNSDMLVFEEILSQSDLEAVAGRFLHIVSDNQAALYLESIDTTGWVDEDIVARHALWLRDNRSVVLGKRFCVEGSAQDVSKMLATRGGVAGRVAEWLVRYLCEGMNHASPTQTDWIRVGNGQFLVNTNAVVVFWDSYVKSSKVPPTPQVGAALRNLATGQVRDGTKRFWVIDISAVKHWSESNLVGDPQIIHDRVFAPASALGAL